MRSSAFTLAAAFLALLPIPGAGAGNALTLEDSVQLAVRSAIQVARARNQVETTGSALIQAYAQFQPTLALSSAFGYSGGRSLVISNGINLLDAGGEFANLQLSSTYNILNGKADASALDAALSRKKASELTLAWAKQQIALDVTQGFLRVILDSRLEEIAKSSLEVSEERLKLFEAQRALGSIAPADYYRQEALTNADRISLSQIRTRRKADLNVLIRKLRLDASQDYELKEPQFNSQEGTGLPGTEAELIRLALSRRLDLMAGRASVEALGADVRVAQAGGAPRLDLVGTVGTGARLLDHQYYNHLDAAQTNVLGYQRGLLNQLLDQTTYSISLNLTWSLFDRGVSRLNAARATISQENARLDERDLQNQVVAEVRDALNNLRSAEEQLKASEFGLVAARKANEVIRARYKVGASSFIDLALAQSALIQAQSVHAQALVNLRLQGLALRYVLGMIRVD